MWMAIHGFNSQLHYHSMKFGSNKQDQLSWISRRKKDIEETLADWCALLIRTKNNNREFIQIDNSMDKTYNCGEERKPKVNVASWK